MRAFLYCRVAHEDSFALEHQRFLLQLYAKKAGYAIIGAADEYGSGLTLDRPALQKVTEAVVAGRVDVVLVHNLARIGREWGMTQRYIDLLTRHKVKLLCIRDRLLFDENGAAKVQGVLEMDCGEGMDTARLQLPGNQNELFTAVCALKKPVISVVIAGRPYAIPEIAQDSDALLYAFYPGPMGGKAIAELLSGKYAPSGRLPVSLPRNCGQLPVYYNHTVSYPAMHYCDMEQGVLYTFGEGMGYSHMEYVDICLKKQQDVWIISGIVKNKGNIDDTAVLQCYRKVLSGELVPRERELVAFSRIKVEKGSHKAFEIVMDADKFRYFNESGAKIYKSKILLMDSGKIIFEE